MTKARKWLQANAPGGQLDAENLVQENFLKKEPHWTPVPKGKKPVG